jgi:hypothetical protein
LPFRLLEKAIFPFDPGNAARAGGPEARIPATTVSGVTHPARRAIRLWRVMETPFVRTDDRESRGRIGDV